MAYFLAGVLSRCRKVRGREKAAAALEPS